MVLKLFGSYDFDSMIGFICSTIYLYGSLFSPVKEDLKLEF